MKSFLTKAFVVAALVGVVSLVFLVYRWNGVGDRITYPDTGAVASAEFTGVLVFPDDGERAFLDEVDAAKSSIRLQIYLLSEEKTIEALINAKNRGVDVRVMLEEHPFGGAGTEQEVFTRLKAAGINVKWSDPEYRFSHIKTIVVDNRVAIVMNLNLTEAAFDRNREFAVVSTNADIVNQAMNIFESDWIRAPDPTPGPLVVSPATSRIDLLDLINNATTSIDVYAEFITDQEVIDALVAAEVRGVEVRLIMSKASGDPLADQAPGFLACNGAEVRIQGQLYIHAKALIVDDGLAWIGSQNLTATSLDDNRELGIILTESDNIARISRAFALDYGAGKELESTTAQRNDCKPVADGQSRISALAA